MPINFNNTEDAFNKIDTFSLESIKSELDILTSDIREMNNFTNFDNLSISQESTIKNILIKLCDVLNGIIKNIYSNLKFLKYIDRSELQTYTDNNQLRLNSVFKLQYTKVANVLVQTPPFNKSYSDAISFIDKSYASFNIDKANDIIDNYIKEIVTLILNECYKDANTSITSLKNSIDISTGDKVRDNIQKYYMNPTISTIEFGKLFKSMGNFKDISQGLANHFDKFNSNKDTLTVIRGLDKSIMKILDIPNNDKKDIVATLKLLSDLIYEIATFYDGFGNLMKLHVQTEHNFIEILTVLSKVATKK